MTRGTTVPILGGGIRGSVAARRLRNMLPVNTDEPPLGLVAATRAFAIMGTQVGNDPDNAVEPGVGLWPRDVSQVCELAAIMA